MRRLALPMGKALVGESRDVVAHRAHGSATAEPSAEEWQFTDARTAQYAAVMGHYVPQPLDVRVIYVNVEFVAGAWKKVCPNIEIVTSPGTHESPDLVSVAQHLRMRLRPVE